jgi:hypothetical protein
MLVSYEHSVRRLGDDLHDTITAAVAKAFAKDLIFTV